MKITFWHLTHVSIELIKIWFINNHSDIDSNIATNNSGVEHDKFLKIFQSMST